MSSQDGTSSEPLALGPLVGKYILPYNTLFAAAGAAAFVLGLVSPVLVLVFGGLLVALALLVWLVDLGAGAASFAWAHSDAASLRLVRRTARLFWASPTSRVRTSALFWVLLVTGTAVCIFGAKGYADQLRSAPPFSSTPVQSGSRPLLLLGSLGQTGSGDPQLELLADALREDVISGLGRIPALRVLGKGTADALKAANADHVQLRERYGITHVLRTGVRQATDQVLVKLELTETASGSVVWTERLSIPATDVADLSARVLRAIVGRAAAQVQQADLRATGARADADAYHLTIRARQLWQKPDRESLKEAQRLLERAISVDRHYAPAYAYLSFTQLTAYNNSWSPDFGKREALERMLSLATQALELAPSYATAFAAQAVAYAYLGRHAESRQAATEAMRLNGGDADTLGRVGQVQVFAGEHDRAIATLNEAIALDPFGPAQWRNFLARAFFFSGRHAEAIREAGACLERSSIEPCRETLAAAHAASGNLPKAAAVWKEIAGKRPGVTPDKIRERLGAAFARKEDVQALHQALSAAQGAPSPDL